MRDLLALMLFGLSLVGVALVAVQLLALARHVGRRVRPPTAAPGISVLKPLRGIDDDLEANLECFATLDYPEYELLLGVKDVRDPAYPVACAAARRWPGRVRVCVQRGEPGFNPKVNQLCTLAAAARHGIVVVSDSNVRVGRDYLDEIAAHFEDARVGLVTHPIVGGGERRLGALMDNLHMSGAIGPGMVAAKLVAHYDVVVGKSMALRRADLRALGGFESVKDVLAEDYVLGQRVADELGKEVVVARAPITNVSTERSVGEFFRRFVRWSVIHRHAVSLPTYFAEAVTNPIPLACAGALLRPESAALLAAVVAIKTATDAAAGRLLGRRGAGFLAVPAKDVLIGVAWTIGLFKNTVDWRGHQLEVLPGTRLAPVGAPLAAELDA